MQSHETPDGLTPASKAESHWVFSGSQGIRAGWSVALFLAIFIAFMIVFSMVGGVLAEHMVHHSVEAKTGMSPLVTIFGEGVMFASLVMAASIMALLEHRPIETYNLTGPAPLARFLSGLAAGFAALSALVGAMAAGGWMHFGPVALSGGALVKYAALWSVAFLLIGMTEEGICRCYLQFTLTRGINFWWALGVVALMCGTLALRAKGQGVWGVYGFALLGLLPCFVLHLRKTTRSGFWQAAWATSTFFGFVHTGNSGENWIGVFAAAAIGFVFCVSIYVTGSAWWAIGCHSAWDWAETFFYGTADSGMQPKGHLLTTIPTGSALWSGGADGPEGSLLVIPVILLLMVVVVALYGRKQADLRTDLGA